ncbi:hypothetical protein OS493_011960 [Desmophyllum pertusum]|uniref:Uncharacterized protein n=1 Tax=Desmophyllum pertusum TaxID=174260 RepID=A0A9X0A3C0_9CNID|nr:hypothetical protein OS493_011960 [Desmophyllum pertusum]
MYSLHWIAVVIALEAALTAVASTNFTDESSTNELNATTVTEGGTFSIAANVSQTDKDSNLQFYYLTLDGPVNRIMKLPKGTDGLGDCYRGALFQDCQSKFSMRYSADYTELVNITITRLTKLLAGKYQLYSYHTGANGQQQPTPPSGVYSLYSRCAPYQYNHDRLTAYTH